jgi:hypothetical protein
MSETTTKIADWMVNGETGCSSKCMAAVAMGVAPKEIHHPLDPADFNRCLLLVEQVPEVRESFPKIRALSPQWAALIDAWDELREKFVAEVGWNWCTRRRAKQTYDRMKELGL